MPLCLGLEFIHVEVGRRLRSAGLCFAPRPKDQREEQIPSGPSCLPVCPWRQRSDPPCLLQGKLADFEEVVQLLIGQPGILTQFLLGFAFAFCHLLRLRPPA